MKRVLILVLVLCSVCFGAYDSSVVDVVAGGYGFQAISGTAATVKNRDWFDSSHPIKTAGILKQVKIRMYSDGTNTPTVAKLKVYRGSSSPYTVVASIDVLPQLVAVHTKNRFTFDSGDISSLNIKVQAGDFVGGYFYIDGTDDIWPIKIAGTGVIVHDNAVHGDQSGTAIMNATETSSNVIMDVVVATEEFIAMADATGYNNGDVINVPYFKTQNQYIIIEDVVCPDTEELKIDLNYTAADGTDTIAQTIDIDFAVSNTIAFAGCSKSITAATYSNMDIYIHNNLATDKLELIYVNYDDGQGGVSDYDIRHISVTDRTPAAAGIDLSALPIRRLVVTNTGGNATIGKITVCRKPVLVVGDSFTSAYIDNKTVLGKVGAKLDDSGVFSFQRYVINGGITGSKVLTDNAASTAIKTRWDGDDRDLVAFKDCVVCFVNGPGLNDVSAISELSTEADIHLLAGSNSFCCGRYGW